VQRKAAGGDGGDCAVTNEAKGSRDGPEHTRDQLECMLPSALRKGDRPRSTKRLSLPRLGSSTMGIVKLGSDTGDSPAVVLFGATGLTGAHILKYLLKSGTKRVLCVVRGHTAEGGKCRIIRAMQGMKIWKPAFEDAIEVVIGDMAKPRLGLTPERYQQLATDTRTIVHAAGDRTWLISQDSSECNQTGLMSIVALARESGASIHYVSSCWVDIYERVDDEDKAEISKLPYVGLKREGEDILSFAAWQHGVDCCSYRVPVLGPNRHGGFAGELGPLNCVQLMMYTNMNLGSAIMWPIMPVDKAAKFMVRRMGSSKPALQLVRSKAKLTVHTALLLCEPLTIPTLCDMVDRLRPGQRPICRTATLGDVEQYLSDRCPEKSKHLLAAVMDLYTTVETVSKRCNHHFTRPVKGMEAVKVSGLRLDQATPWVSSLVTIFSMLTGCSGEGAAVEEQERRPWDGSDGALHGGEHAPDRVLWLRQDGGGGRGAG
jgi:thioester reductase-like protein